MRLLSDTHGYTPSHLESSAPQYHLQLPEVWPPAQYLIDMGLRPSLARRLSTVYMDFVDQHRKICRSHFDRASLGGCHLNEYYREVFVILFKRTVQAWGSQIVSIVRVQLCQAGSREASIRPERVDVSIIVIPKTPCDAKSIVTQIRVDDVAKAEIMARLGFSPTHLTFSKVGFNHCFFLHI